MVTYACVEGEVSEGTVIQQTSFIPWHSVTDLDINQRSRAPQGSKIVDVSHTSGVLRPGQ